MKKKIFYLTAALILIVAIVAVLIRNKSVTELRAFRAEKNKQIHVQAEHIKLTEQYDEIIYSGTFEPARETKLSSDIQGKIIRVLTDAGKYVRAGETLIMIDNSLMKLQLQTTQVQIEGLQSDVNRFKILAGADAVQKIQLEKAELALKTAQLQKATIEEQINKTFIKAPFAGVVTSMLTEEGAFAAPGVPLLQIIDISSLKFTANIPEEELPRFNSTYKIIITPDIYPEDKLTGILLFTGSRANQGNNYPVQFAVNNISGQRIKAGMFGKVSLTGTKSERKIVIPASAITGSSSKQLVYTIKDGKAIMSEITVSGRYGEKAVISSGLKEGDILITNGFINLFNGANVKY
ncbi:MAG: efflux RND transporter periplasmic adaptor subunit [Ignavibacteriaceae bacterium]|nr:efflux RND transporter periplasmic adaptor subunit [Ignavibacteriaceae bacterium]